MASKRLSSLITRSPLVDEQSQSNMPSNEPALSSRLRKPVPSPSHSRSPSSQLRTPVDASYSAGHSRSPSSSLRTPLEQPSLHELQESYRGVPSPLLPPAVLGAPGQHSRSSSQDRSRPGTPGTPTNYSRPQTPTINLPGQSPMTPSSPGSADRKKEKSGFLRKSRKDQHEQRGPVAWIAGHPEKLAYDVDTLVHGRPVSELCDDSDGNCFIYLFPRQSGKPASFKVDSQIFASSPTLTKLAFGDIYSSAAIQSGGDRRQIPLDARTQGLSLHDPTTPPMTPKQKTRTMDSASSASSQNSRDRFSNLSSDSAGEAHLYLPLKLNSDPAQALAVAQQTPPRSKDSPENPGMEDVQTLVDIRNFFAFLCGQSLVATEKKHSFFHIFMTIAGILKTYQFSNLDGSTYGEIASSSFDSYVSELGLDDVRTSREKTIEGVVLGERMKSVLLYNEAFTHAVGKHEDLVNLKSVKFSLMSSMTDNRLIRAAMDLDKRTASIRLILTNFDIPELFTGIMASRVSVERKEGVRFDAWKEAFLGFRKNYIALLKHRYGDWPPKAKSKKNDLETSGLNRSVLRDVYHDMSSVYDLLVDRHSLTSRTVDGVNIAGAKEEPTVRALRAVLSEYDRSSPPVKPPVPFDLPKLPSLKTTRPGFGSDKRADLKAIQKKLKDDEIRDILGASHNSDAAVGRPSTPGSTIPMVDAFREMESRAAHNCTIAEIVDLRLGQWIFMYIVLQALPMLAIDAPGLKHTKGVEYFLCEPPRNGVPWAQSSAHGAQTWFQVEGGGGVVSLPSDVVQHGVEGIYRRSHCWTMAEKWTRDHPVMNEALHENVQVNAASANNIRPESAFGSPTGAPPLPALVEPPSAPGMLAPGSRPSSQNQDRASKRISSLNFGLEALPLPYGVQPDGMAPSGYSSAGYHTPSGYQTPSGYNTPVGSRSRPTSRPGTPSIDKPVHVVDANRTFDAILGGMEQTSKRKK